jgi:hypothetical protein
VNQEKAGWRENDLGKEQQRTGDKAPAIATESTRRRGRPALPAGEGKRYPLAIRTTKTLKDQLVRASQASGRSLAQEVEHRLELSFMEDRQSEGVLEHVFTRKVAATAMAIALAIRVTVDAIKWARRKPRIREPAWLEDPFEFGQIAAAVNGFLACLQPEGGGDLRMPPERLAWLSAGQLAPSALPQIYTHPGMEAVEALLAGVITGGDEPVSDPREMEVFGRWLRTVHDWLGSAAVSRLEEGLRKAVYRFPPRLPPIPD